MVAFGLPVFVEVPNRPSAKLSIGNMDLDRVRAIVAELDDLVSKEDAVIRVEQLGGGESFIEANQGGYLRLGIAALKAAFAPLQAGSPGSIIDINDPFLDFAHYLGVQYFERREDIERQRLDTSSGSRLIPVVIGGGCIAGIIFSLIGIGTVLYLVF